VETILKPILQSPQLKSYVEELQEYLRAEDERRTFFYNNITDQEKAEFINGEIIIHSPVVLAHGVVLKRLLFCLDNFIFLHDLGFMGFEKYLVRMTRNDYEPDLCFFNAEKAKNFTPDQKLFPSPDWVAEILSKSTEKIDRGVKMEDYALHGVREYWLIEPNREYVEQYYLKHGSFFLHKIYSGEEVIDSEVFVGLNLPANALFNNKAYRQYVKQFF
jgi:Uma2 family endonuclease